MQSMGKILRVSFDRIGQRKERIAPNSWVNVLDSKG